jgi:7-cyano-7-deazaguanine synthase
MWLQQPGCSVAQCLTFDYGQRSAAAEARAAQAMAGRHGLPWRSMSLPWLGAAALQAGSALMDGGRELPRPKGAALGDAASAAAVWVPARNLVFIAVAAAIAESQGADCLLAGFNREEAETFPDNSVEFVHAMDQVLALGTRNRITVCSPTLQMDKVQIVARARELGLGAEDFWSCYGGGPAPCGTCESCRRSEAAWDVG